MQGIQTQQAAQDQAAAGQGFLSISKCVGGGTKDTYCAQQCIGVAGGGMGAGLNADYATCYNSCEQGTYSDEDICKNTGGQWTVNTPGYVAGDAVTNALHLQGQWAVNVQSIISAIVNAAINRLMKEGLSLMTSSNNSGGSSGVYTVSSGYSDVVDQQFASQKQQMLDQYNLYLNDEQAVLSAKNTSLTYNQQMLTIYNTLKSDNCQIPAVLNINTVNSDIARLTAEASSTQQIISDAQAGIDNINSIQNSSDVRDMGLASQQFSDFTNKYSEIYYNVTSGSDASDANAEADQYQQELATVQNQLNLCIQSKTNTNGATTNSNIIH